MSRVRGPFYYMDLKHMDKQSDLALDLEEQMHMHDYKEFRKERKRLSEKDRSKYKKTDIDKRKKQQPSLKPNLLRGRIFAITPDGILVSSEDTLYTCSIKGSLKQEKLSSKNIIAVGDFVQFERTALQRGVISFIEKRYSILSRADHLSRRKQQLIAVNIDQVLITTSILLPSLKPTLIDRYIIAAKKGNIKPVLIINKIDLLYSSYSGIDQEKQLFHQLVPLYRSLGIEVHLVNAVTGEGIEDLKRAMTGKSSVFSGQSGTGKSSLINALFGLHLPIGEIIEKTRKGSHTTTSTFLFPLEKEGFCIDTPGIRSFGLWNLPASEIQDYFSEIEKWAKECKFNCCTHRYEPDCAVKQAVEREEISHLRYHSYCSLLDQDQ